MADELLQNDEEKFYNQLFTDFNKTKEDLHEYIDIMRKWANAQPHFPEQPSYHTLRFSVLYNKFSIEKAKQKLDMYYTIRNLMPEYFKTNPFSPAMAFQNKVMFIVPLPKVTEDYIRIIYHRLSPEYDDPKHFSHDNMICQFLQVIEFLLEEDLCYRFHYVFDCAAMKLGHGTSLNPMSLKKSTIILEKVFSNRMSSFYLVNVPHFLEAIINTVVKPLLSPKIRKRVSVHPNTEVLLEVFGKERMPKDVGGEERPAKEINETLMQVYRQRKEKFFKLEKLGVNESLRPTKLENDELLGYYGNFRKIGLD